jgi:hypothetical protein
MGPPMTEPVAGTIYVLDTNVFMDWQFRYYPTDIFPSLLGCVDALIEKNRCFSPQLVEEELGAVGTTELKVWADSRLTLFVPLSEMMAEAISIQARFPGLLDPKATYEEADAYVIAYAKLKGGVVVTQETSAAEKRNPKRTHFIPDVCRELGLPCISFLGLMRREGWTL